MLAEPDLSPTRQRAEREVIHAEFIAWSRNAQAQRQFAQLQAVSPRHPLRGFHAGNRYSLAVGDPAFQEALKQFHQRFYQGNAITLSLCGPQSLDELHRLGSMLASRFASGPQTERSTPPALLDGPLKPVAVTPRALDLLFAHERLPTGSERAFELLQATLTDSRPGTWLGALRQRGWLHNCQVEPLYAYAGQLLWRLQVQLKGDADQQQAQALLQGWLGFIAEAKLATLNPEFGHLQRSRALAASALDLARRDAQGRPFQALDEQAQFAFKALLRDLPKTQVGDWQLPVPEPLLDLSLPAIAPAPVPTGFHTDDQGCTTLYLRWHITSAARERLFPVLEQALRPLIERAQRASLQLRLEAAGPYWTLRCSGAQAPVIRAIEQALQALRKPTDWQADAQQSSPTMPLRALINALPSALHSFPTPPASDMHVGQAELDHLWSSAQWQGLATGVAPTARAVLGGALRNLMGHQAPPSAQAIPPGRHWRQVLPQASEHALLLFCPLPPSCQASGRLLAHLLQGPFYQRLRVELQLGYGVFSAYRQMEGLAGLLFGVQSPHASHGEILEHLQTLLRRGVTLDTTARQALAEQFTSDAMNDSELAEWAWQTQLATHDSNLSHLHGSILMTGQTELDDVLSCLLSADHGWLCVANGAAPDQGWQC